MPCVDDGGRLGELTVVLYFLVHAIMELLTMAIYIELYTYLYT